jgi:hypothetical protein
VAALFNVSVTDKDGVVLDIFPIASRDDAHGVGKDVESELERAFDREEQEEKESDGACKGRGSCTINHPCEKHESQAEAHWDARRDERRSREDAHP